MLQEIFAVEITIALGTCDGCGAVDEVGAVAVYVAAGPSFAAPTAR
jgi:Family of unknown function (DUF6510)